MILKNMPPRKIPLTELTPRKVPRTIALSVPVVLAVFATALTVLIAAPPPRASAQSSITPLDPALCATTYKPTSGGSKTEADCRSIVAWRNAVVAATTDIDPVTAGNQGFPANHPMMGWGKSSALNSRNQQVNCEKFNTWWRCGGISITTQPSGRPGVPGEPVVKDIYLYGSKNRKVSGPLPGPLPYLEDLVVPANKLTGGLPSWIYGASNLVLLDLRNNQLSGTITGSAFRTPKITDFLIQTNKFSGPVPNLPIASMPLLTDLRISSNQFSGPIPASWSALADGRGIERLQAGSMELTGNLPSWVSNLKFSTATRGIYLVSGKHYLDFSNNKLCIPRDFTVPTYLRVDGTQAPISVFFNNNRCPTPQNGPPALNAPPGKNVQFEIVDVAGVTDVGGTTNTRNAIRVTWEKPEGLTGSVTYKVTLRLLTDFVINQTGLGAGQPYYFQCITDEFSKTVTSDALSLSTTLTRNDCNEDLSRTKDPFDPSLYVAQVTSTALIGGAIVAGQTATSDAWTFYIATDSTKTYRDASALLGLDSNRDFWLWDVTYQTWRSQSQTQLDYDTTNLVPNSLLAAPKHVPASWLPRGGLSTADTDTPVRLQNGWNLLPAGGFAQRGEGFGAFFIDDSLIDCDSLQGVIAIYRYSAQTRQFDVELPCHPSTEATITRGGGIGKINTLNELDALYIYFRSALPVSIAWDDCEPKKYVAASAARAEADCPTPPTP